MDECIRDDRATRSRDSRDRRRPGWQTGL